jgi:D-tyrosyl-tRNA(Tyr) deacylase
MRVVVTRVREAGVRVGGEKVGEIGRGLLVLLGVGRDDTFDDARALARRVVNLRIFPDDAKPMNRDLAAVGGELLVVSQFTLLADTSRGRRPSFVRAAEPERAEALYAAFVAAAREAGFRVETGRFGATMQVASVNDGPVTLVLDTERDGAS